MNESVYRKKYTDLVHRWNSTEKRSPVGLLLYLAKNTCPDITFAISQVAHFTHSPKKFHAAAVEMVLRYLKGTADKHLIVMPDGTYNLDALVDSDFVGLYGRVPGDNPNAARSRYGYITTCGAVPVYWKSQLISEICLSTLQHEYIGSVNTLRALIPVRGLVVDIPLFSRNFVRIPSNYPVQVF